MWKGAEAWRQCLWSVCAPCIWHKQLLPRPTCLHTCPSSFVHPFIHAFIPLLVHALIQHVSPPSQVCTVLCRPLSGVPAVSIPKVCGHDQQSDILGSQWLRHHSSASCMQNKSLKRLDCSPSFPETVCCDQIQNLTCASRIMTNHTMQTEMQADQKSAGVSQ